MFGYEEYKKIIEVIKNSGKQANFETALEKDSYVIMRHDVEFSVERAFKMARLEEECEFNSTYFFQVSNNAYNLLSKKNLDMLEKMNEMGHKIGLHFHMGDSDCIEDIINEIKKEIDIMNAKLSFEVNSFSVHRPTTQILESNIKIPGIINAYQDEFFSYVEDMSTSVPEIKYLSDARHRWNYGLLPNQEVICGNAKVQILTHPYSWTEEGYDNLENFRTLYAEKREEMLETFDSECKHFKEIKNEL